MARSCFETMEIPQSNKQYPLIISEDDPAIVSHKWNANSVSHTLVVSDSKNSKSKRSILRSTTIDAPPTKMILPLPLIDWHDGYAMASSLTFVEHVVDRSWNTIEQRHETTYIKEKKHFSVDWWHAIHPKGPRASWKTGSGVVFGVVADLQTKVF